MSLVYVLQDYYLDNYSRACLCIRSKLGYCILRKALAAEDDT